MPGQRRHGHGEVGMHINAGDTAWMLTSTALVFFMMPGLALFYGGLVGAKNVIATMVQSFVAIGVISLLWVILGYSLAFGANHGTVAGLRTGPLTPPEYRRPTCLLFGAQLL